MDITRNRMRELLSEKNYPDFVSFTSVVPVEMNQYLDYWIVDENGKRTKNPNPTPNPFYNSGIKKLTRKYKIVVGFDYEKSVNRRREKEGKETDFESQRPVWFEMISKSLVTDRKTHSKFYLRYQYSDDSTIGEPEYIYNEQTIEKELFESYMRKVDYQNQYSNQGLDDTLNFQVCNLDHITDISMNGEHYHLID